MGRAEAFAMKNPPVASFLDGIGNGLGYGLILMLVGVIRELFGSGSLFGITILRDRQQRRLVRAQRHAAAAALGLLHHRSDLIWAFRTWKPEQVEEREFKIQTVEAH
jgi:Na+-transporting NADH:ubiquinone oxidoreductase subunit D